MRSKAFFINGGAGRVICSIPALEKYAQDSGDKDFIIVAEGGTDFYKGHPTLYSRVYDNWHKNLFEDKLKDMDIETPEPYRVWEYYNQKCNLTQAFDIAINGKGVRDLPKPTLKLSVQETLPAKQVIKEVKEKNQKDKVVVFQPFGRGTIVTEDGYITDSSGRSFEAIHTINIVKGLQKAGYAVIIMSEFGIDFKEHGCKDPVAMPQNVPVRTWAAIIGEADIFLGCDSVGQHLAYSLDIPSVVVMGSTFKENVSYPECEIFNILDMGGEERIYSPIRITADEVADRRNEGIMIMNEKIENHIVEQVDEHYNKHVSKKSNNTTDVKVKSLEKSNG